MTRFADSFIPPIKSHPGDKVCQCYPEGRNDCPDHMRCREHYGWLSNEEKAQRYAAEVRARNPAMQVKRMG